MDLLKELELLAQKSCSNTTQAVFEANIGRWQVLFGFSRAQAEAQIESHINNLERLTISDEYWAMVRDEQEALGHDKESYSFLLSRQCNGPPATPHWHRGALTKARVSRARYLFKLEHPLDTAQKIQKIANLTEQPEVLRDADNKTLRFVQVDMTARDAIEAYLKPVVPTFITLRIPAEKDLSDISMAPNLGIDATLPQHRPDTTSEPHQYEYPVPYFFYGTLAEPIRLIEMLGLSEEPILHAAIVRGGRIRKWREKYFALIDGDEKDEVRGWMYVVKNKEDEDVLRSYEGGDYEVVRCGIFWDGAQAWPGLTFRFCGDEEMLGDVEGS